jgi:hypothetical protein
MGNAEEILVVVLASALAVFLLLAIIATVKIIQILNHLKAISEKAERLASTAESVGEIFKYTAGPAAIGKFLANITETVLKHRKKGGE